MFNTNFFSNTKRLFGNYLCHPTRSKPGKQFGGNYTFKRSLWVHIAVVPKYSIHVLHQCIYQLIDHNYIHIHIYILHTLPNTSFLVIELNNCASLTTFLFSFRKHKHPFSLLFFIFSWQPVRNWNVFIAGRSVSWPLATAVSRAWGDERSPPQNIQSSCGIKSLFAH